MSPERSVTYVSERTFFYPIKDQVKWLSVCGPETCPIRIAVQSHPRRQTMRKVCSLADWLRLARRSCVFPQISYAPMCQMCESWAAGRMNFAPFSDYVFLRTWLFWCCGPKTCFFRRCVGSSRGVRLMAVMCASHCATGLLTVG